MPKAHHSLRNIIINIACVLVSINGICQSFTLSDTTFEIGSTYEMRSLRFSMQGDIIPETEIILDSIVKFLKHRKHIKVEFGSHTDTRGTDSVNLNLSQNRADWIKDLLLSRGVSENQITSKGYGESQPKIPEDQINKHKQTDRKEFNRLHFLNRRDVLKIIEVGAQE